MKARIISKTYYVAESEDGRTYDVDMNNPLIKKAYDNNIEIEGVITYEEKQSQFSNGDYDRSYFIVEKFIPFKEKYDKNVSIPVVEVKKEKISEKIKSGNNVHIGLPKK